MRVLVVHSEIDVLRGGGENSLATFFAERDHGVAQSLKQ
jgi:hypothetical protein